jgi:hypothetical protein
MSTTRKRLGVSNPSANTDTALYTVPGSATAVVSMIQVCNQGGSDATFRIAWVDGAIGVVASEDYLYYDVTIPANDSICVRSGLTMESADTILVRASTADVSFVAGGIEITESGS